jgi:hypothetical protein
MTWNRLLTAICGLIVLLFFGLMIYAEPAAMVGFMIILIVGLSFVRVLWVIADWFLRTRS